MKKLALVIIVMFILSNMGKADSLTLSFFQNSTDNLFQNSNPEKDQISNFSFSFDKSFKPFSFFTEGNYSHLYENTNVSYYTQDLGLDYLYALNEKTAFYLSVKGTGMFYRAEYADFNYFSLGFIAAVKTYITESSIMKLNYTFDYKNYRYSLFDFRSHLANFSVDRYFKTRTTLKAELNWGYKYFFNPYTLQETSPETQPYFHYAGRRGHGPNFWRPARLEPSVPTASSQGQGIQIFSLTGLIAQGIGDKVGVRISGLGQWTLSGENPFASVEEFYMVENPSYDIFSWNGSGLSGQATFEAPWNTQLKIGYTRFQKEFPGIEAMSLDGVSLGMTRKDKRNQWEARLEKNWPAFSIYLSYSYVDNHSNDPFFDWNGHFLSVGFEWGLTWGERK